MSPAQRARREFVALETNLALGNKRLRKAAAQRKARATKKANLARAQEMLES
jgi:hypothetical protein